jgi:hypothetical protein
VHTAFALIGLMDFEDAGMQVPAAELNYLYVQRLLPLSEGVAAVLEEDWEAFRVLWHERRERGRLREFAAFVAMPDAVRDRAALHKLFEEINNESRAIPMIGFEPPLHALVFASAPEVE